MCDESMPEKDKVSDGRLREIAAGESCARHTIIGIAAELGEARQELYGARLEIERLRRVVQEYADGKRGPVASAVKA